MENPYQECFFGGEKETYDPRMVPLFGFVLSDNDNLELVCIFLECVHIQVHS
jgi:hypothetical protein